MHARAKTVGTEYGEARKTFHLCGPFKESIVLVAFFQNCVVPTWQAKNYISCTFRTISSSEAEGL